MTWRRKWARNWDEIKYCSDACRKRKVEAIDIALENAIVELLRARAGGHTICPSEAARLVVSREEKEEGGGEEGEGEERWRGLMERTRMAARRLVVNGSVVITQRGQVVDPSTAKGPIRIRFV